MSATPFFPECGLSCIAASLSASACPPGNSSCLCDDSHYNRVVSECVHSTCTSIADQLATVIASAKTCQTPVYDRSGSIATLQIIFTVIQDVLIIMRVVNKLVKLSAWGLDDVFLGVAWMLQNGVLAGGVLAARAGLGRDVWGVPTHDMLEIIQIFFAFEIIYAITLASIKISICFLFFRLFPDTKFRRWLWATQVFNIALVISFVIANFLQCRPLPWFWERLDPMSTENKGWCLNLNAVIYSHGIINIILDVWMIMLPATQVWNLNMALKKKLRVLFMFSLGFLSTAVSGVRLGTLYAFGKTENPTQDLYDVSVWSCIELTTGVIVACLPPARQVWARYVPHVRIVVTTPGSSTLKTWGSSINNTKSSGNSRNKSNQRSAGRGEDYGGRRRGAIPRSPWDVPMTGLTTVRCSYDETAPRFSAIYDPTTDNLANLTMAHASSMSAAHGTPSHGEGSSVSGAFSSNESARGEAGLGDHMTGLSVAPRALTHFSRSMDDIYGDISREDLRRQDGAAESEHGESSQELSRRMSFPHVASCMKRNDDYV